MAKYPSEIFGYFWKDKSKKAKKARKEHICPFHNSTCFKQSRLLNVPFGVCTAHVNDNEIALCPRRFLEGNAIFRDIAINEFGSYDNTLVFSEVGLKGIGNFDFVMIKHKPLSATVEDFVVIEFQTGQTTGTGELVNGFKDYFANKDFSKKPSYGFGINSYDIWKRTFTQILNKGIILEKWKKKIYWVVQQPIFDYFHKKYRLKNLSYNKSHSTVFALYDLVKNRSKLSLVQTNMYSSTVDDLFNAFRKNDEIPPIHVFIEGLEKRLKTDFRLGLSLKISPTKYNIDAPKPSTSGIVKEQSKNYGE